MATDPRKVDPRDCFEVTPDCPVEASLYGYYPSLPVNAFFTALFAVCFIANLILGYRHKIRTYSAFMALASLASAIGYGGRIKMASNPYDTIGFQVQICCLTFSPAFNAAAIYLMLKHIVQHFGRAWSRLRPKYYTWGFITADFLALILQAAGGGLAATSDDNDAQLATGDGLMQSGIAWQVLTLVLFGGMVADFLLRRFVFSGSKTPLSSAAQETANQRKFQIFAAALTISYFAILIRCVYRIAEMAGGWRNPVMQNQALFIGLDSVVVGVATVLQTVVHPGFCFGAYTEKEVAEDEKTASRGASREAV